MGHTALPLKYRPMTFADVVGQEHVVRTLRHAIESGRIANAYLFIGPRGIGKTTTSRIFAKALNCLHPKIGAEGSAETVRANGSAKVSAMPPSPTSSTQSVSAMPPSPTGFDVEPCGHCANCEEIAAGRSLDVTELDAASHNRVEDVKPIIDSVQFKPTSSKYKIFIVDECHMLSNAAWNALLKTLEEPPPYVKFIFATTEGDKVLPTIISRCQRFDLRRIQTHDIVARLKYVCEREKIAAEEDALLAIARGAEGGMRDALSSLDQLISFKGDKVTEEDALGVFGLVSRSALENLAGAILKGDTATILNSIETFDSAGKNMRRLSGELLAHFRNLVVLQALGPKSKSLAATPDQIRVLEEQAKGVDPGRVFRVCDQIAEMEDKLRYVLSVRTLIEMSLIRASRLATVATVEELMRAVKALKEGGVVSIVGAEGSAETSATPPRIVSAMPPSPTSSVQPVSAMPSSPTVSARSVSAMPSSPTSSVQPVSAMPSSPTVSIPQTQSEMMDDDKLNDDVLGAFPGATITGIHEGRRRS